MEDIIANRYFSSYSTNVNRAGRSFIFILNPILLLSTELRAQHFKLNARLGFISKSEQIYLQKIVFGKTAQENIHPNPQTETFTDIL